MKRVSFPGRAANEIAECGLKCKNPKIRNPKSEIQWPDAFCVQSTYGGLPGREKGYLQKEGGLQKF
jgi:hypothetical protein